MCADYIKIGTDLMIEFLPDIDSSIGLVYQISQFMRKAYREEINFKCK